jgi:ectoine hydroxylase-related dioxygenase (phytanoyl-CoA dioxygenase family)
VENAGFQTLDGLLTPTRCDRLRDEIVRDPAGSIRAGTRHLMSHPSVAGLATDASLLQVARQWVGPGAVPYRATLFDKSPGRNWLVVWHQDTALPLAERRDAPEWGPWSIKEGVIYAHAPAWALSQVVALRIHLDASTLENGPLKVIPGSHAGGVLSDPEVFGAARDRTSIECLVGRGGVMAMRPLLIHASSKARTPGPRRVLHLEYAASLDLGAGFRLAVA